MATISHHHVSTCLHHIHGSGINADELLSRAGINPAVLATPNQRVHTDQVARLFRLVQQTLNDEYMGFAHTPCKFGVFAMMAELLQHCKTLGDLLEKACHYNNLLGDAVELQLDKTSTQVQLSAKLAAPQRDIGHFLVEYLFVTWHRFPSWYIGEAIHLRQTHFTHAPPPHKEELEIMFPSKVRFNQPTNSLIFDAQYLHKPLVRTPKELDSYLQRYPADLMTIPGENNSLESRIERLFISALSHGNLPPSVVDLSESLNLSPLTLYRKLQREGTTVQKIKDNVRREIAIHKLISDKYSVEEISTLLGFEEPRSFSRAFKNWTGLSPRNYCKHRRH